MNKFPHQAAKKSKQIKNAYMLATRYQHLLERIGTSLISCYSKLLPISIMPRRFNRDCLSQHDQEVLDSVFNPLQIGGGDVPNGLFDPEIKATVQDEPEEQTEEVVESTRLEAEGVHLAEKGELEKALEVFNQAMQITPDRSSLYNNRAQVLRLQGNESAARTDLNHSIELCSNHSQRTKCQALCQRGVLFRKEGNLDAARDDFQAAAKLGSQFARTQLVEINPYAALCNQMLSDAFEKLK